MDPITTNIVTSLAVNYFTDFSGGLVKNFFNTVIKKKPEIEHKLKNANTSQDFEEIFNESIGVIDAEVKSDEIRVFNTFLEALKGIRFNHGNGTVTIQGTTMSAPVLVTGGNVSSTGNTIIGEDTELISKGTSIRVGKGSGIYIGGDSQIRQN